MLIRAFDGISFTVNEAFTELTLGLICSARSARSARFARGGFPFSQNQWRVQQ
jgi:hypothetical protein